MADLLLLAYASAELVLALHIALSNFVVILVYLRSRHIRTPTNEYIFSLALTDFLAGALGIPFTVASVLTSWPNSFLPCLAIHLILCVLCTISTFHLLAMAIDKYMTICMRKFYQRNSSVGSTRKSRANLFILASWFFGTLIGGLPLLDGFGFASSRVGKFSGECHFTDVVDYRYLVFIIFFGTIILPSVIIAYCYVSIYAHIRHEERQIKCLLRASERQRRISARRKLIRILLILVLTYAICWYPLYLINTADLFLPSRLHAGRTATLAAVVLSHLNCALNPLIYAYGVPGFKQSLRRFMPFFSPASTLISQGGTMQNNYLASNAWRYGAKQSSYPAPSNFPMGNKRTVPVGKFTRAISTIDTAPPVNVLCTQPSSFSLLQTKREQFRKRNHENSHCAESHRLHRNNNSTETTAEEADRCSTLEIEERHEQHRQRGSRDTPRNSVGSQMSNLSEDYTGEVDEKRKRSKQKGSIASKVSVWSVRLFSGNWMVRGRKDTGGEAQRTGEDKKTLLVEKCAGGEHRTVEEEGSSSKVED